MTSEGEIYPKAPLVEVAYEVRFPSLFYIHQMIGELQLELMDDFPNPSQYEGIQFTIEMGEPGVPKLSAEDTEKPKTCWQFKNESGKTRVRVNLDRLSIISNEYKSYNQPGDMKFRDIISKVISKFTKKIPVKKFTRIGLRYIDHCPLEEKTTSYFANYYLPIFDMDNYKIEDLIESHSTVRVKRDRFGLLFQCGINKVGNDYKYIMDFDGYALNVDVSNYLSVTDDLHIMLDNEFNSCTTEKFKQYMRGQ